MKRFFFLIALSLFAVLSSKLAASKPISLFVVIPSYNNEQFCAENLASVAMQKYPHWHAYYINDCSDDATGKIATQFVHDHNLSDKITIINNKKRLGALANTYNTIQKAHPDDVVIIVDGDDKLFDDSAFGYIAETYQKDPEVWLTYGNYLSKPNDRRTICKNFPKHIIRRNDFRSYRYRTGHLRTFYAGLFHLIKKEDLMENGEFLKAAGDVATMLPMCELAVRGHIKFIQKILYVYNDANPLSDFRNEEQGRCSRLVRSRPSYKPLRKASWR